MLFLVENHILVVQNVTYYVGRRNGEGEGRRSERIFPSHGLVGGKGKRKDIKRINVKPNFIVRI
jgi:hypothetical protein